ncbi:hypothetical protein HYH03_006362 [Edaphochlamys debaryana]|uniref:Uncharacterized protein n=1 Tax=Edaphochlamys debaryana TaxID=47281 RepID=A0A836C073_9CHLO|nr:hypothetical protein HYH03_006362 [Edaphochlamys debaryana]|eukprot:KAG2495415.1 hypothetical protein HYH03_006362 [Edaphochlamys debaryana]
MSVSTDAFRVRVQLQVEAKNGQHKEVVRKCTSKGNEVVEVDGFKFIRKRKAVDIEPAPAHDPDQLSGAPTSHVSESLATDGNAPQGPGEDGCLSAPGLEAAGPLSVVPPQAEGDRPGPDPADPPGTSGHAATPNKQPAPSPQPQRSPQAEEAEPEPSPSPPPPPRPPRDLAAEISRLPDFLPSGCPTAFGMTWLLEQALRLSVPASDEEGTAAADAVLTAFKQGLEQQLAAAQALLQRGGTAALQQYDRLPPAIRQACAGDRVAASLRQRLAALEAEETAWLALEDKYSHRAGPDAPANLTATPTTATVTTGAAGAEADGAAAGPDAPAPASASGADTGGAGAAVEEAGEGQGEGAKQGELVSTAPAPPALPTVDLGPLEEAQRRADMQLSFQVEAVGCMLDKAERLVEQAQAVCALLQADYHKENFQSYAHVNSPHVLVKILSQAQPSQHVDFVPASQPSQA